MKKVLSKLQDGENFVMALSLAVMTLASFAQVVNRNFVHAGISWFEELSRYCMIYMTLLAAEAGLRDGTQLSITAVTTRLKGKVRKLVLLIAKACTIVFSAVIFGTSFQLLQTQVNSGQTSPGLKVPMYIPYAALPISFGIIIVVQTALFIKMLIDFPKEDPKDDGEKKEEKA